MTTITEDYTGKIVVVTGSSRGVGKLAANHFLTNGATVAGISRGEGTIDNENYHHYSIDISDSKQVRNTFFKIGKEFKTVHIVVNNAAVLTSQYSLIMPAEDAEAMININLLGTFYVSREAAKLMKKSKFGRIINIGSMASSLEPMGDSIYAASKAGVITLANVMAKEFSGYNVTCNTLGISAYETDM
ncbi:MAG: SDR family oxidoreductase, partial [Halobacteriovoraceae bacterium]|nr:SDR family oxidoreductase [Halobacteriovoraceae bacterium]